jgi:hypothetical protein
MRTVLSSVLATVIALPLASITLPPISAHAAAPTDLVLNEINWAGSASNPNDQWVELYNPSATAAINLGLTPYKLYANGSEIAVIDSGVIAPKSYYMLGSLSASSVGVLPGEQESGMVLPKENASYVLKDNAGVVVDQADDGQGAPFAGNGDTSGSKWIASMSRRTPAADGQVSSSWFTPATMGAGFDNSVYQYGTPGQANAEIAKAKSLTIAPASPTAETQPVVSGNVTPAAGETAVTRVHVYFSDVTGVAPDRHGAKVVTSDNFSITAPILAPGMYRVSVVTEDAQGNTSGFTRVTIPGSPQNVYVVNEPLAATVAVPKLNAYPSMVGTSPVTLTGTVEDDAAVVVSINGVDYATATPNASNAFSITVNLVPNTVNHIEVRARDMDGNVSEPAVATITHDSIAPARADKNMILVHVATPNAQDSVEGLAGATEPSSLVEIYADAGLLTKIGSANSTASGSFPAILIGNNAYGKVYLVVKDAVGNVSPALELINPISFADQSLAIGATVESSTEGQVTVTWKPVNGAVKYRLKYKTVGGAFSHPVELCTTIPCSYRTTIANLKPGTSYVIAIAAVDASGNESGYTESTVSTKAAGIGGVNEEETRQPIAASGSTQSNSGSSRGTDSVAVNPTPTATPAPTATPDENGEVKSEDTADTRNWTPWIILGVLVLLALLATVGYFYWFGADENDGGPNSSGGSATDATKETSTKEAPTNDEVTTKVTKKGDREKRW